jgi:hypothetical protein
LEFFRACVEEAALSSDLKKSLFDAVDSLLGLYNDRNSIVHGQYGIIVDDDGNLSPSCSDIGKRKDGPCYVEPAPVEVGHLMQHADAVYEACKPLRTFLYRHLGADGT